MGRRGLPFASFRLSLAEENDWLLKFNETLFDDGILSGNGDLTHGALHLALLEGNMRTK